MEELSHQRGSGQTPEADRARAGGRQFPDSVHGDGSRVSDGLATQAVQQAQVGTQERSIWEVDEMRAALDSMEDPILHLAVHLTLVGALREGEVAGLPPEDIDFDAVNGMGTFTVNRSMQRVQKVTPVRICW